MQNEQALGGSLGWLRGFTRYQWMVFLVCWLGWSLDITNFTLFALVLKPTVVALYGGPVSNALLGKIGGWLAMAGLMGWAVGGFVFGTVADYLGRVRTLAISIAMPGPARRRAGVRGAPTPRRGRRAGGALTSTPHFSATH